MNVQIAQASPLDREAFVEAMSRARMHAVYPAPASVAVRRPWPNFEDSSFRGWWARVDRELVGVAFRQLIGDRPNQYAVADVCVVPSAPIRDQSTHARDTTSGARWQGPARGR